MKVLSLIYIECSLVSKKAYHIDLTSRENKNLSPIDLRARIIDNIIKLASVHANYKRESKHIKMLIDDLDTNSAATGSNPNQDQRLIPENSSHFETRLRRLRAERESSEEENVAVQQSNY